jgi:hypothetical protein
MMRAVLQSLSPLSSTHFGLVRRSMCIKIARLTRSGHYRRALPTNCWQYDAIRLFCLKSTNQVASIVVLHPY